MKRQKTRNNFQKGVTEVGDYMMRKTSTGSVDDWRENSSKLKHYQGGRISSMGRDDRDRHG